MIRRPRQVPGRVVLALLALLVVAVVATLAAGDRDDRRHAERRSPAELAELLVDAAPRPLVVDTGGRPVRGRDGRPLRVGADGRTLVDSRGRALRDARGRPLTLGRGGTVPSEVSDRRAARRGQRRVAGGHPGRTPGRRGRGRRPAAGAPERRPLVVGVAYQDADRIDAYVSRYGFVLQAYDAGPQAQAVADHINAAGGIGGRRLVLRPYRYDLTDGRPYDVTWQEVCTYFSDGPRPAAVLLAGDTRAGRDLALCLAPRGIPLLTSFPVNPSTEFYAQHPSHYFSPGGLAIDRFAQPYVRALQEAGFFAPRTRVGLIRIAHPEYDVAVARLRAALAEVGVRVVSEYAHRPTRSTNDVAGAVALLGNAAVRFRAAGVDRVISADYAGAIIGVFMQAAEPQGFRPLYGLSTLNSPMFLRASIPTRQLRGAVGIGWSPLVDVGAAQEGAVPATRAQCAEIYRRAGVAIGDRSAAGEYSAFAVCDSLLVLRRALRRGGDGPAALRAGIEALGTGHASPLAMATRLDAGHHDGAAGYRLLRYDAGGCECFRYEGPVRGVP